VICSRQDYQWARLQIDRYALLDKVRDVLLSPSHGQQEPRQLAEWILHDRLDVRLQLQLHKLLWQDQPGH